MLESRAEGGWCPAHSLLCPSPACSWHSANNPERIEVSIKEAAHLVPAAWGHSQGNKNTEGIQISASRLKKAKGKIDKH